MMMVQERKETNQNFQCIKIRTRRRRSRRRIKRGKMYGARENKKFDITCHFVSQLSLSRINPVQNKVKIVGLVNI